MSQMRASVGTCEKCDLVGVTVGTRHRWVGKNEWLATHSHRFAASMSIPVATLAERAAWTMYFLHGPDDRVHQVRTLIASVEGEPGSMAGLPMALRDVAMSTLSPLGMDVVRHVAALMIKRYALNGERKAESAWRMLHKMIRGE